MVRIMKNSGIDWIGEIPNEWTVGRFKNVMKKEKVIVGKYQNENIISLTKKGVIVRDLKNPKGKMPTSFDGYQKVEKDDLLLCLFDIDVTPRCVGIVKDDGITSPAYSRYRVLSPNYKEYLNYFLTYIDDEKIFLPYTKSLRNTLTDEYFGMINVLIPSPKEQLKISNFLNEKIAHINSIIEKTNQSIEAFKRYKQAIITETVTKGLNLNTPTKDSKFEWIGEIPEHWSTLRVKYASYLKGRIGWQGLTSEEYQDEGPYLITGKDFNNGSINWDTCTHITKERYEEAPDIHVHNSDLLITKDGTIGKIAIVSALEREASLNSGVLMIRKTVDNYDEKYLYYVLCSEVFWKWYNLIKSPNSTILHLYQNDFKDFTYPLPSKLEQQQIAIFLDKKTFHIDSLISSKEKMTERLSAYKKALIYEYVTGKKEVR